MGSGCVIVFYIFALCVVGTVWLACLLAFMFARRKKWRMVTWLAGIPVVVMPLLGAVLACLFVFAVVRSTIPRYVYQDTFHERPSADVRNLKTKTWSFADEAHLFMRFEASAETFHRILPKQMERVTFSDYRKRVPSNNLSAPRWWAAPRDDTGEIYLRVPDWGAGHHFASESELMTYDPGTKTAMYFYLGID